MKFSNKMIIALVLVSVILVSGCAQKEVDKQPSKSPEQSPTASITATETPAKTPSPSPIQVSIQGDALGSEIAKSDALDEDVTDTGLDNVDSDLGAVENGL